MSVATGQPVTRQRFRFPSAFSILFGLIALVAVLTRITPAGQYETVQSDALGREVPVAGTYQPAEPNPQGLFDVVLAPVAGLYDPVTNQANAIDVALFVLVIGGFIGVVVASAIVIGVLGRLGEQKLVDSFVGGARELLGVALIIGLARGIVVIMDAGRITDTILHWAELSIGGLSSVVFVNVIYWIEVLLSFFVPSTSGLAVLSMPIMAPVADFAGVGRELVVTAYQSASGIVNLVTPTSAVVMGGLAIGRVPYERWLVFMWPLLMILTVLIMAALSVAALVG